MNNITKLEKQQSIQWQNNVDDENNNIDILRKTINVKTLIKQENKLEIKELLNQRQWKIKILNYVNIIQIFLLIIAWCFWFLSTSFKETWTLHNIFWMISGMCSVLYLSLEWYKKMIYKQLTSIKNIISAYDDTSWKNDLLEINE